MENGSIDKQQQVVIMHNILINMSDYIFFSIKADSDLEKCIYAAYPMVMNERTLP